MGRIDVVIGDRLLQKPRLGFAAGAPLIGPMGTIIDPSDRRILLDKPGEHPAGEPLKGCAAVVASGDAGLVGDDQRGVALISRMSDEIENTRHKLKFFRLINITVIDIHHAVSIEKERLFKSCQLFLTCLIKPFKRFRGLNWYFNLTQKGICMKKVLFALLVAGATALFAAPASFNACVSCHGASGERAGLGKGRPLTEIPAAEMVELMKGYKAGTLNTHGMGALMRGQMANLSEAQMQEIADFSGKK